MSGIRKEVLAANDEHTADFGGEANLPPPSSRHFAILTCIEARLDPAKYAGLTESDAHGIRNADGRALDDAIRSLVISYKLLGKREWFVIHYPDRGIELFSNGVIAGLLDKSLETASLNDKGSHDHGARPGSVHGHFIKWHTIADQPATDAAVAA